MTPDQRFARWVQIAIAALVCAFIYFLFADLAAPLTPQAQLNRPVVRIAPRVSGQVVEVAVANNQHVEPGDLLFRLDPEPFRLHVRQAELAVEQAIQENAELDANLQAAEASVGAARASLAELSAQSRRLETLLGKRYVPRQQYEQVEAHRLMAAAELRAAQAKVTEIAARRGRRDGEKLHFPAPVPAYRRGRHPGVLPVQTVRCRIRRVLLHLSGIAAWVGATAEPACRPSVRRPGVGSQPEVSVLYGLFGDRPLLLTLIAVFIVHRLLNRFPSVRHQSY
ncbi:hypothetical protein BZL42_12120 [Pseudomonas indica]|nr:hypothetical protein BZL42_12120 [Pseudomonas indica]